VNAAVGEGEEFDFESANARFSKEKLLEDVPEEVKNELPPPATSPGVSIAYNKVDSFFDSISCETLERSGDKDEHNRARVSMQDQRKIDTETFGVSNIHRSGMGRGGGRGGRRFYPADRLQGNYRQGQEGQQGQQGNYRQGQDGQGYNNNNNRGRDNRVFRPVNHNSMQPSGERKSESKQDIVVQS